MVAYDGSEAAGRALDAAADLAGYGSTLAVVTVHTGEPNGSTTAVAREQLLGRHSEPAISRPSASPRTSCWKRPRSWMRT